MNPLHPKVTTREDETEILPVIVNDPIVTADMRARSGEIQMREIAWWNNLRALLSDVTRELPHGGMAT